MLVLGQKVGDSIRVADNIWITTVAIKGDSVRLGFIAPLDIPIVRSNAVKQYRDVSPDEPTDIYEEDDTL